MTRGEAIYQLELCKSIIHKSGQDWLDERDIPVLDMAIEALQEQKTGRWIPWKAYYGKDHKSWSDELKCSECGFKWGDEEYKFCPMCGTEMEKKKQGECK